jgi:hypothetical protein
VVDIGGGKRGERNPSLLNIGLLAAPWMWISAPSSFARE